MHDDDTAPIPTPRGTRAVGPASDRPRFVVGVMTGTSLDGLDAALVRIDGRGLSVRASLLALHASPFPAELAKGLRAAAEQTPLPASAFARLAVSFATHHIDAIRSLTSGPEATGVGPLDLIVAHGQTIFHAPPCSWQLLQPAPIVEALGVTTVCDLRQADLAAGGQGAPITPLADWLLFRAAEPRAIVNLGGFCNLTFLPGGEDPETVRGADVCACNQVLDAVARRALGQPFDADGAAARRGRVDEEARDALIAALRSQRAARRSLGTGDEALEWVERIAARRAGDDVAATATAAVGQVIGEAIADQFAGRLTAGSSERPPRTGSDPSAGIIALAGGGARHRGLAATIAAVAGRPTRLLDELGVPIAAREAMAMAVLGTVAADGIPLSLAQVTGRRSPRALDGLWAFARPPAAAEPTIPYRPQHGSRTT